MGHHGDVGRAGDALASSVGGRCAPCAQRSVVDTDLHLASPRSKRPEASRLSHTPDAHVVWTSRDLQGALLLERALRDTSGGTFRAASARVRAEIEALVAGIPEGKPLTERQSRLREAMDEASEQMDTLLDTLGTEHDYTDPRVRAALTLVATVVGRNMALETRIAALEWAAQA